jgi:hypothetical protein
MIYISRPKVLGHLLFEYLIQKWWALIWSWSPHCCYNNIHIATGTFFHSATIAFVRLGTDVRQLDLAQLHLPPFISKVFNGAVVAPRCFHFTITALTVDQGSSSRAEIWPADLLSSSVRPFYYQYFSMAIAWLCARFYTPVSNWCRWNGRIH